MTLEQAAERYRTATESITAARTDLRRAILAAVADGVPQVEIVRVTGLTRETIRRIARSA